MSVDTTGGAPTRVDAVDSPTVLALLFLVGILSIVSGPFGFVVGAITVAVWYAFGLPAAIAIGHVALLGLFPDGIGIASFVAVEFAFVGVLLADPGLASRGKRARATRVTAVALGSVGILGGVTWIVLRSGSLWIASGVFLVVFSTTVYGLHRYEQVAFGLMGETDIPTDRPQSGEKR